MLERPFKYEISDSNQIKRVKIKNINCFEYHEQQINKTYPFIKTIQTIQTNKLNKVKLSIVGFKTEKNGVCSCI